MTTITRRPTCEPSDLTFSQRLSFLSLYYFYGPLFGFRQNLIVADEKPSPTEEFAGLLTTAVVLILLFWKGTPPAIRFGLLVILASTLIYAFTTVKQLVLEYRAYVASLGIALIAADLAHRSWIALILSLGLVVFLAVRSRNRVFLFTDPVRFWQQAAVVEGSRAANSTFIFEERSKGRFQGMDRLVHLLMDDRLPITSGEWINAAQWAQLPRSKILDTERFLEEVTRCTPSLQAAWRNLGVVSYYLSRNVSGEIDRSMLYQAVQAFSTAVALDSNDVLSYLGLGQCYLDRQNLPYARQHLKRALELTPDSHYIRTKYLEVLAESDKEEFQRIDAYFRDRRTIYVTSEMLPPELQERYRQIQTKG